MKFFEGWISLFRKDTLHDSDLKTWARIEYKHDAEFAYNHMKEFGLAPTIGVKI